MPYKISFETWMAIVFKDFKDNFYKYEAKFQIIFGISLTVFITLFSILFSQSEATNMTVTLTVIMAISLYITIFSGWLLIRNAGKTETNRRLANIETLLGGLVNEIRLERESRQQGDKGK